MVDDEIAILEMTRFGLEQSGLQVQTAENAYDALLQINDSRPNIILMDWMMPASVASSSLGVCARILALKIFPSSC